MNDESKDSELEPEEAEPFIGWAEVLTDRKIARAINRLADAYASHLPDLNKLRWRSLVANLAFGVIVLGFISASGYFKIISSDVTGSLFAGLIGYWYGTYRSSK